jgi:2-succinyl-5-enolpyruvyl-6-hydroxy-3-cyclohexene-1-carboxylate synthase
MTNQLHHSLLKNPNLHYAWIFINALAHAGLRHVCIAPGSRSTPLTLAFDAHPEIGVHVHLDERSAGFYALGMALELDAPVALVCSSGTAVANFYPAIIEANMSQIPLLVLTADRPHELRHSGANQTIDQVKMFGNHVLWAVDMPVPQPDPPEVALRNVAQTAVRAYTTANGIRKGPVHINFPFRKPLEPEANDPPFTIHHSPFTIHHSARGTLTATTDQLIHFTHIITEHKHGLIICGPRCPGGEFPHAVAKLAQQCGYPMVADSISGLRFGAWVDDVPIISSYETFMQAETAEVFGKPRRFEPDVIIRFGAVPTSKWLNSYLDHITPAHRIHIRSNGVWADDSHRTTLFLQCDETAVCHQLTAQLKRRPKSDWEAAVRKTEDRTWERLSAALKENWFDGAAVAEVVSLLPNGVTLFTGNSSPIRHLDQYGRSCRTHIHAYANRGASGIDGNISTALGITAASKRPLIAILGDITFYHDMNGLLATSNLQLATCNITFIVINNNGGGIFNRLPIAQHDPPFTKLFRTPHGLTFAPVAELYGMKYAQVRKRDEFKKVVIDAMTDPAPHLIELITDHQHDEQTRRVINQIVNGKLTIDN